MFECKRHPASQLNWQKSPVLEKREKLHMGSNTWVVRVEREKVELCRNSLVGRIFSSWSLLLTAIGHDREKKSIAEGLPA